MSDTNTTQLIEIARAGTLHPVNVGADVAVLRWISKDGRFVVTTNMRGRNYFLDDTLTDDGYVTNSLIEAQEKVDSILLTANGYAKGDN